ncbi:MAG: hypothetical protein EOO43_05280 [Flavobacterium sp.]|nr:MAG: hypothetical protein EOO43_05280 [Flavobacterium sp.]
MKKITTLILVLICSSYSQAQKETSINKLYPNEKIELNLSKGETYRQNMATDMSMDQNVGGEDITIKMHISGKTAYKVLNVMDTIYDIEVRYESLAMKMDIPGGGINIDSETQNTGDVFSKVLAAMKKHPFQVKISKRGKVLEVKNIDHLYNAFNDFPELPAAQKEQIKKQLAESYGEKSFRNNLEISLCIFPVKTVSKGERWTIKGKFESGTSAEIETTYELKEVAADYYLLTSVAKISTLNNDTYVERNGMQIKSSLNGTTNAEIKIDKKTGWIIYSKTNQQMAGTTTIKGNDAIPGGMTLPIKMNNIITISGQ